MDLTYVLLARTLPSKQRGRSKTMSANIGDAFKRTDCSRILSDTAALVTAIFLFMQVTHIPHDECMPHKPKSTRIWPQPQDAEPSEHLPGGTAGSVVLG